MAAACRYIPLHTVTRRYTPPRLGSDMARLEQSIDGKDHALKTAERRRAREADAMLAQRLELTEATLARIATQLDSLGAGAARPFGGHA